MINKESIRPKMVSKKLIKHNKNNKLRRTHRGGSNGNTGYTFDQKDVVGGQMARVGYSHCDTPAYYNQYQVYDVALPTQSAGSKSKSKSKSKSQSKSKSKSKSVSKKSRKVSKRSIRK